MAFESLKVIRSGFSKKGKGNSALLEKNKIRSAIENMCKEYLLDFEDILTFEALPNALDNTLALISEPELNSKYEFFQESETLFQVRLRELSI